MFKEVLFKPIYFGVTKSTSKVIAKLINHAKMAIVVLQIANYLIKEKKNHRNYYFTLTNLFIVKKNDRFKG